MAGYLTTHVLDTALGCPAEGLKIELFRISGVERHLLKTLTTNNDGRTDEQILPEALIWMQAARRLKTPGF